jgi:rhamnosyltransferase subunit B
LMIHSQPAVLEHRSFSVKNIVVATIGSSGDVLPFVAMGGELRKRGHEVTVITNPHFQRDVVGAGLKFKAVGTAAEHSQVMNDPELFLRNLSGSRVRRHFARTIQPLFDTVASLYDPGRTVVLSHECPWSGAWIAAEKFDIPLAVAVLSPSRLVSRRDPPHPGRPLPAPLRTLAQTRTGLRALYLAVEARRRLTRAWTGQPPQSQIGYPPDRFLQEANRVRARAGLRKVENFASAWRDLPQVILCMWPEWLASPQRDWLPQAITAGFPLSPPWPPNTTDRPGVNHREAIVFTTGSVACGQDAFFRTAVDVCRRLGRPGVLVTPHRDQIPPVLPPLVSYVPHAPFGELFANAAAVVHHGGIGTMALALAAGIPQVVRPIMGEQFDCGYRVRRLGTGRMMTGENLQPSELANVISFLLTSKTVQERCRHWRDRMRTATMRSVVEAVEALRPESDATEASSALQAL